MPSIANPMRWVFSDRSVHSRREREHLLERMDAFFGRLAAERPLLAGAPDLEVEALLAERLQEFAPWLELEICERGPRERLLWLADRAGRGVSPAVEGLAARAPELPDLAVVGSRPASSLGQALETVERRCGVDLGDARVRAGFARGHLLELVVYSGSFASATDERALAAAELLLLDLLGQRLFDDWIGEVRVAPLPRQSLLRVIDSPRPEEQSFPLAELPEIVARAVAGLHGGLPDRPLWQAPPEDAWTMFELEPELTVDYAAQDDLAIASTLLPEMLKCFLSAQPFSSVRFSRYGERFAYLKLDGDGASAESRLGARRALEDRLAEELPRAGAGAVVGSGMGVRYAYIDLALADTGRSVERVIEIARACGAPERSWLLFCDSAWAEEWVEVWEGGPPPLTCP
jgi:hypothetical protein